MEKAKTIPSEQLPKVKELLANTALSTLLEDGDISDIAYASAEFGYIYLREGTYEALFKIIAENQTFYFVARHGELLRLQDTFTDAMFQGTTQQMETIHGSWH